MFRITMQFGGKPIRKFTFDKSMIAIGRDATCDIVVENIGASRRHATIEKADEGWILTDLKSHNGTYVNGEKIFHHQLTDSDEFFIGKYCFIFERLEPVVECDDGVPQALPSNGGGGGAAMPDMTFRLDRKEIERIMGTSARGSSPQLVQVAPEDQKFTQILDKAYYLIGTDPASGMKISGFMMPKQAAVVIRGDHGFRVISTSGKTKVNGRKVTDSPLVDGDLIQIGSRPFRFCVA